MHNCLRKHHQRKFLGYKGGGDSSRWCFGWCNVRSVWDTKKTFQYEFWNSLRVSSSKSTWCTATQSCYKYQAEIGQSCRHVLKHHRWSLRCESGKWWEKWCTVESSRVRMAAWCYEGEIENCFVSWEYSDTDTDPRQVRSREYASKQFNVSEYLTRTARELKKVGRILAKLVPKKGKTLPQETLDLFQSFDRCWKK